MFSKLAKAFKPKSVKISLETPRSFNWSHKALPVTAALTNRAEEACTIERITFQVREKQENETTVGSQAWEQGMHMSLDHEELITLGPGESRSVAVEIPVSMEEMTQDAPGWMKLAGKAIDIAQRAKGGSNEFEVRVLAYTQGAKNPRETVKTIGGGLRFGN